jgi:hypothetical protein
MTANKSVTANFGYPLSVVKAGIGLYILKNCLLKSKISNCPTQRAPDWWESARFQAVFLASSWCRQSGVVSSRSPAGNASR